MELNTHVFQNKVADANITRYYYDGFNRRVMKDLDAGTDILYLSVGGHHTN